MAVTLTTEQQHVLVHYVRLFEKWNKAYNLSAVRDIEQMVDRHLLDSLSVVPWITATHLIDVGTGGGLPGIPLAIAFPDKQWTLLDSNGKKTRFLTEVKHRLNLHNVTVINSRVEKFQPEIPFDGVTSRAFASLKDMVENCDHLLSPDGEFYAMKGLYPEDELSELEKNYKVSAVHSLRVPREPGQRHLLVITR